MTRALMLTLPAEPKVGDRVDALYGGRITCIDHSMAELEVEFTRPTRLAPEVCRVNYEVRACPDPARHASVYDPHHRCGNLNEVEWHPTPGDPGAECPECGAWPFPDAESMADHTRIFHSGVKA